MRHQFTTEERRKGGWVRARQIADVRRANPTPYEKEARESIIKLVNNKVFNCGRVEFEVEFWNDVVNFPQFFDVYFPQSHIAVEIDGSKGWHDHVKMKRYDEAKRNYCAKHRIILYIYSKKGFKLIN